MIRYALGALIASVRASPLLYLLSVFGVALGVASVLSIQIINQNSLGAFEGSLRAVSGDADLIVTGRARPLDERLLADLLADEDVRAAFPLHRVDVAVVGREQSYLEILGFDFFASTELPFATERSADDGAPFFTPGWCAISEELAEELELAPGDPLSVSIGSRVVELTVGAQIDFRRTSPLASSRLVVMDIAQAQALTGEPGRIHEIDLKLTDGADRDAAAARLAERLGPAAEVRTPTQRRDEAADLLGAFRLNLTAMSLISVFVGAFLVHAATQASLIRRRSELGVLRSLGATRGQVLAVLLFEVVLLGVLGTAIGLPLGWLGARANVEVVSATLSNLYVLDGIERLVLPPWLWALAVGVGVGGALLGALIPALDASRRETRSLLLRSSLHEGIGRSLGRLALVGLGLLAATWGLYRAFLVDWRPAGFFLAIGLLLAVPALAPWVLARLTRWMPQGRFGLLAGVRGLGDRLQASAFAVAALAVTVSMLIGITLMIGSFRRTVSIWIDDTLQADVYITSDSWRRARQAAWLDRDLVTELEGDAGVRAVYKLRQADVTTEGRRARVSGSNGFETTEFGGQTLLSGDAEAAAGRVAAGDAVLITEPLARKVGLSVGDRLPLSTPVGDVSFEVAGIAYDYSSEIGGAMMSLDAFARLFGEGPPTNLALALDEGLDAERYVGGLRQRYADRALDIRSNRDIKDEVFAIFDQTFAITRLLQAMSLVIAVAGIALTLLVLARERVAELALYRSLGATRRQIARLFLGKGLGLAVAGLGVGAVGGVLLAFVLIFRINRDYFGWTIALHWPWAALAEQAVTILLAAAAASLYPALRAARTPATELSRDDL